MSTLGSLREAPCVEMSLDAARKSACATAASIEGMWRLLVLLLPISAMACKCQLTLSACRETAASEVIFIGTVEAISPSFLDQWNPEQTAFMALINREYQSSEFPRLRDAYL